MSGWAGCLLSDALGDGRKLWQDSQPPPIYPWAAESECKTSAPAACARLSPALPRALLIHCRAAQRDPGLPGTGRAGGNPLSAEVLEGVQRTAASHHTDYTCLSSAAALHRDEGVHPGSPHSPDID